MDNTSPYRADSDSMERQRFRMLAENAPFGMVFITHEGNYFYINPKFIEIFGYNSEDTPNGKALFRKAYPDKAYRRKVITAWIEDTRGAQSGEKKPRTFMVTCKDGTEKIVNFRIVLLESGENIMTCEDITEKQKLEEDLLRIDKLESVGVLAGGIAHDFNNILSVILGNISLARMYVTPDEEKLQKRFNDAEQAILRAKDLTQQLLTFSRGGSPVKTTSAIQSVLKASCRFAVTGSNIQCEFDLPNDLLPVDIDAGQINQVINNVVINAQQAMPHGGAIHIKAENIVSSEKMAKQGLVMNQGAYVKIVIQDNGIGIPKENIGKIFDPYFTTKEQGSGLGLATSHSIIKKHGGYISVDSLQGKGTVFSIYLPASSRNDKLKQLNGELAGQGKGKILVMDDEDMIREITGELLQNLGYQVEFAKNGNEAIGLYGAAQTMGKPFDAVILDLTVPGGMGGKEAICELLAMDPETKAIVTSGYSNDPIMSEFGKYGFCGVIIKPYHLTELSRTLQNVLNGAD